MDVSVYLTRDKVTRIRTFIDKDGCTQLHIELEEGSVMVYLTPELRRRVADVLHEDMKTEGEAE